MQPIFRVVVNQTEERLVASPEDINSLCNYLAVLPVFIVDVTDKNGLGANLVILADTGRARISYLDIDRGVKLGSQDQTCTRRGIVRLTNVSPPFFDTDVVECRYRDLISPERAIFILGHYLKTGEPIDLVPWPSPDYDEWSGDQEKNEAQPFEERGASSPDDEVQF